MVEDFKICFWNTGYSPYYENNILGSSSIGFAANEEWVGPESGNVAYWEHNLIGESISGSYETALKSLTNLVFEPKFCLAFFNKAIGIEDFLHQYNLIMPHVHIIGGGAARADGQNLGELIPSADDVIILAVSEGDFVFQTLNLYKPTGISVEIKPTSVREFGQLRILPDGDWKNALEYYCTQQLLHGIDPGNFELMTFCDNSGRNIHSSTDGQILKTGANLPTDNILHLYLTSFSEAAKDLATFISDENSLIFGCAGIRSLLSNPLKSGKNSLTGFMFGELVILNGQAMFGNLMLVKIIKLNN